jgi:hypothetical protein
MGALVRLLCRFHHVTSYGVSELVSAAIHESGHVVASHALGCRVHAATINGATAGTGCAFIEHRRLRTVGDVDSYLHSPVPLWPAGIRRRLEIEVMFALAGWAAEGLAGGATTARRATPAVLALDDADEHGRRRWPDPPNLNPAERATVTAWQAEPPSQIVNDDRAAADVIGLLHGGDVATGTLHARWLNAEVRRLLEQRFAALERVADALLASGSLGGRDIRRLVNGDRHSAARVTNLAARSARISHSSPP